MAARKKKQPWNVGDAFYIPLKDGDVVLGQIVGQEADALNSVTVALFDVKCKPTDASGAAASLDSTRVFSVLFVTRDLLDRGEWKILGPQPIAIPTSMLPYEHLRSKGWIGATIHGSGIVNEFVDAFYGFREWDAWHDPKYLDRLLSSPDKKPTSRLIYKSP